MRIVLEITVVIVMLFEVRFKNSQSLKITVFSAFFVPATNIPRISDEIGTHPSDIFSVSERP